MRDGVERLSRPVVNIKSLLAIMCLMSTKRCSSLLVFLERAVSCRWRCYRRKCLTASLRLYPGLFQLMLVPCQRQVWSRCGGHYGSLRALPKQMAPPLFSMQQGDGLSIPSLWFWQLQLLNGSKMGGFTALANGFALVYPNIAAGWPEKPLYTLFNWYTDWVRFSTFFGLPLSFQHRVSFQHRAICQAWSFQWLQLFGLEPRLKKALKKSFRCCQSLYRTILLLFWLRCHWPLSGYRSVMSWASDLVGALFTEYLWF